MIGPGFAGAVGALDALILLVVTAALIGGAFFLGWLVFA